MAPRPRRRHALPLPFEDLSRLPKLLLTLVKQGIDWFLRQLIVERERACRMPSNLHFLLSR